MNRKTTKILSALLLAIAIAVTQIPVSDVDAQTATSDFQMEGTTLLRYSGTAEVVSVPDEVKIIESEAFSGNPNIVKLTVGGKTEKIGIRAFADCNNLRTVVIGDQVSEIDAAAFSNNKELKNISLGAGLRKLGAGVFAGSSNLEEVSISENNTFLTYMDGILYDTELTTIYQLLPAYKKGAFTIPGTVTEIKAYSFWGNPHLEKVTLGSGLREVPAYAFSNCISLREVVIPLPVRSIEAKAFEDCVNLISVAAPESIVSIHETAFDGCPNVSINAQAGSYAAQYAESMKKEDAEQAEYEDVSESQVVTPEGTEQTTGGQEEADGDQDAQQEGEAGETPDITQPATADTQMYKNDVLLGESSIVSGKAMIFIDNRASEVYSGSENQPKVDIDGTNNLIRNYGKEEGTESLDKLISENAQKGSDFPKFTIVDNKIAAQAYYQSKELTEYEFKDGITEIGEFAFARTGLKAITISEGVEKIGYGAFYHCDSLASVVIPPSVKEIEPYAFEKTPWIENVRTADWPFLIAGDGILIYYAGGDSVINIPDSVKQIGPGVFRDHMGITAVNISNSVEVIGEEAFRGCKNLKTVNGGKNLIKIKDRAFKDCPLASVTIPETVREIGLGAFELLNGTDTIVFEGTELPFLTMEQTAQRLSNKSYRTYALGNIQKVYIPDEVQDLSGSLLEQGSYGTQGIIYNESEAVIQDNSQGMAPADFTGVKLDVSSSNIQDNAGEISAVIPGNEGAYLLKIADSDNAAQSISAAYGELYGGREPANLIAYDMNLYDASGTVSLTRLGKQYMTVMLPKPASIDENSLHVVTLDHDGQLEAVENQIVQMDDGDYIQLTIHHFSPIGIYQYDGISTLASVREGKAIITDWGNKDNTPNTGDDTLHPKWFLAFGFLAASVALFFYQGKRKTRKN